MKILVADDDPVSRTMLVEILHSAQAGYDILSVNDGDEAWATLQSNLDTKLAIIDLVMPGMDGFDLLKRARSDPRFTTLPIIVCTGNSDRATVTAAAKQGVSDFVVKPFSRSSVLQKVWHHCRPANTGIPVLKNLSAARQTYDIDRDTHRELLGYYVRVADIWAADARRATEFPRVRALAVRANRLKDIIGGLGAAALAARFQEAETMLGHFRAVPLVAELPGCIRTAHQLGEGIQQEVDRLREMLDTIA